MFPTVHEVIDQLRSVVALQAHWSMVWQTEREIWQHINMAACSSSSSCNQLQHRDTIQTGNPTADQCRYRLICRLSSRLLNLKNLKQIKNPKTTLSVRKEKENQQNLTFKVSMKSSFIIIIISLSIITYYSDTSIRPDSGQRLNHFVVVLSGIICPTNSNT